jgi:U-box domain-containing protein 5
MLFDFCDGRTKSQISCDKVCTDSNPVENLISMEYMKKNCGFIGENFVRPPVNITLQFPCNIELFRVVINPVVGAQKSSGFEIYSSSNKKHFEIWRKK